MVHAAEPTDSPARRAHLEIAAPALDGAGPPPRTAEPAVILLLELAALAPELPLLLHLLAPLRCRLMVLARVL